MKIHEYQAADLFQQYGIPVARGRVASTCEEARSIAGSVGYPVVLKSQVLVGGRGKAGGIKIVRDDAELARAFGDLRVLQIKGYPVEKILVVRAVKIIKEFYAALTVDAISNDVVLIASASGGVEIEETARTDPGAIKKYYLEGRREIDPARFEAFLKDVFADPALQKEGSAIFRDLLRLFFERDCSLAEINPLVVAGDGHLLAVDAKINFDDNALFRQEANLKMRDVRFEDPDELEAKSKDLSFVKLDGNVGCIVNGAGLAMATMDVVKLLGGSPANFLDVGGSSNPEKVLNALNIILKNPSVKAILINIFGGITRCDDIARGILQAKGQIVLPVPLVVRLTGTNEEIAKDLLAGEGISTYATMREAVQKVVALAK